MGMTATSRCSLHVAPNLLTSTCHIHRRPHEPSFRDPSLYASWFSEATSGERGGRRRGKKKSKDPSHAPQTWNKGPDAQLNATLQAHLYVSVVLTPGCPPSMQPSSMLKSKEHEKKNGGKRRKSKIFPSAFPQTPRVMNPREMPCRAVEPTPLWLSSFSFHVFHSLAAHNPFYVSWDDCYSESMERSSKGV
jgi:hypothetical protein